ncbi:hypothetical protein HNR06_003365 [Nocardiopsis arvandica]|uniref:DUF2550 domain-containing protein n=1 Tax=Nocardiopsis sinuspersici TaxID=501010 RepID=A0A7Z0BK41_9ACTN|nr:DUF2550 domain-containing protein [Nocardiopsis sinuspersici]NYH53776.1 hypothetical protein [Nocardiopsis sinuspersici]
MERLLPGTPWLESAQWVFYALLLVLLALVAAVTLRRWVLVRRGGAVECYLRAVGVRGRRGSWRIGFGRYGTENLGWFPIFSLRPRPTARLSRRGLVVVGRRAPEEGEDLPVDLTVLRIGWAGADGSDPREASYEIAMNEGTLTGFLSWLESMPPGTHWEG